MFVVRFGLYVSESSQSASHDILDIARATPDTKSGHSLKGRGSLGCEQQLAAKGHPKCRMVFCMVFEGFPRETSPQSIHQINSLSPAM